MHYENAFFPWGGFPYPYENAKLALDLLRNGERERADQMFAFQQATIDHHFQPLLSFFRQEKGISYTQLKEVNKELFEALGKQIEIPYVYRDKELGILTRREEGQTIGCFGSGCKSGMGFYLAGNGGVLNYGVQLKPLGDCSGFGLAGRGTKIELSEHALHSQCRLAAPHPRKTGIPWLEDSGFAGMWIESTQQIGKGLLKISAELEGFRAQSDFLFTFFVQAEACYVAGSHKLKPRSLNRYQGPPQKVLFNELTLLPENGFHSMEVVPLAGDESYWGADFMITLSLLNKTFQCSINKS